MQGREGIFEGSDKVMTVVELGGNVSTQTMVCSQLGHQSPNLFW